MSCGKGYLLNFRRKRAIGSAGWSYVSLVGASKVWQQKVLTFKVFDESLKRKSFWNWSPYRSALGIENQKKSVVPRNLGQRRFIELILKNDLVFGIGPAGTGKTYLRLLRLSFITWGKIQRIVLARPAVEAGEALGFLPGDLEEKLFLP